MRFSPGQPGAVNDVGHPVEDGLDHLGEFLRIVFQVRVLDGHDLPGDMTESRPQRRPLAPVPVVEKEPHPIVE